MTAPDIPDRIVAIHLTERDGDLLDHLCEQIAPDGIDPRSPDYQAGVVAAIVVERLAGEAADGGEPS